MSLSPDTSEATEKALIEAKREGFAHGRCCYAHELDLDEREKPCDQCVARAKKVYPIRVSRPRVVKDCSVGFGRDFRVVNGTIQTRDHRDADWYDCATGNQPGGKALGLAFTPERIRILADLLNNPTELVDAE